METATTAGMRILRGLTQQQLNGTLEISGGCRATFACTFNSEGRWDPARVTRPSSTRLSHRVRAFEAPSGWPRSRAIVGGAGLQLCLDGLR